MKYMGFLMCALIISLSVVAFNNNIYASSCCGIERETEDRIKEDGEKSTKAVSADQKSDISCAVCGKAVDSKDKQVDVEHGGKTIHLCCEGCASAYNENPDKYSKVEKPQEDHRAKPATPKRREHPGQGYY